MWQNTATSCISFDSYIKPQRGLILLFFYSVVYLLIPTSNHNRNLWRENSQGVVYLLIPTSNHNLCAWALGNPSLYIFWFLHQTTTRSLNLLYIYSCISFDSYIKPQLVRLSNRDARVVYLLIPTSNHNSVKGFGWLRLVVYLLIPTSNHNITDAPERSDSVVYLLIPTSNHNQIQRQTYLPKLYIFWFLHQTTTPKSLVQPWFRCISFDSYIKPQLIYLTELNTFRCISFDSYIKPQLRASM